MSKGILQYIGSALAVIVALPVIAVGVLLLAPERVLARLQSEMAAGSFESYVLYYAIIILAVIGGVQLCG